MSDKKEPSFVKDSCKNECCSGYCPPCDDQWVMWAIVAMPVVAAIIAAIACLVD